MTTTQTDPGASIAARIREARRGAGLTQGALAALIGVTDHTVWCWESGRRRPTPEHLTAITFHCERGEAARVGADPGERSSRAWVRMPLEERMRVVVVAIADHVAEHGYPPSVRELMDETGFSSESVVGYSLDACDEAGLVVRARGMARAVRLTEAGRAVAEAPPERGGQPVVRREDPAPGAAGAEVASVVAADADPEPCAEHPRLAERMRAVVDAIADYVAEHGYPPTMQELQDETGFSSKSVVSYSLDACEEAGLIVRARGMARAVTLTEAGRAFAEAAPERGGQPVGCREGPAPGATGTEAGRSGGSAPTEDPVASATGAAAADGGPGADRPPRRGDRKTPVRRGAYVTETGQADPASGIAARIREARRSADLTQRELAALVGVTSQTVWSWEADRMKPTYEHRIAIAFHCGTDVGALDVRAGRDRDRLQEAVTAFLDAVAHLPEKDIKSIRLFIGFVGWRRRRGKRAA